MKHFGIITHYDVHNHGALLQLTALVRVLASMDIEAKALRFDKNYDFMDHRLKAKYNISLDSVEVYFEYLKKKGFKCLKYNYEKRKTLNKYKKNYNLIGDYYSESEPLDAVIVGSDEVFALHTGPTPVFFGYCLPSQHVISYAGSFGPTTIEDIDRLHARTLVSSGLKAMKAVTVRDANSADVVANLIGKRPDIVVDPVLLYGFEDEIRLLPTLKEKEYILVYAYDNRMNSPEEVDSIIKFAKSEGLKIVSAGFYHPWCDKCVNVNPIDLLAWFKNAKFVVTDTFHGSIMSIITGVKFAVITRDSNYFKLYNLLNEYGLTNRVFDNWPSLRSTIMPEIDYEFVSKEVYRRRSESLFKLKENLPYEH